MAATTSFGKKIRRITPPAPPPPPPSSGAASSSILGPSTTASPAIGLDEPKSRRLWSPPPAPVAEVRSQSRVPFVSFLIVALLVIAYRAEDIPGFGLSLIPSNTVPDALLQAGVRQDAIAAGEWWRLFTAPWLHESALRLFGSVFALVIAGLLFERVIGRVWFAALFAVSALGGSIGSLYLGNPATVTGGAAGAAMGMLAAALVCSFLFAPGQVRWRMQRGSLRLLIPSLLPAALPLLHVSVASIDYATPLGGAIAGGVAGFILGEAWREGADKPGATAFAFLIAALFACVSVGAFVFVFVLNR